MIFTFKSVFFNFMKMILARLLLIILFLLFYFLLKTTTSFTTFRELQIRKKYTLQGKPLYKLIAFDNLMRNRNWKMTLSIDADLLTL